MDTFESDHCPVCHKPVATGQQVRISEEQREALGDQIYVPGETVDPDKLTEAEKQQREDILKFLSQNRPEKTKFEGDPSEED